ncbi:MAG: serine hydrolase domain-containing protein [Pseudomonadales bacterium]
MTASLRVTATSLGLLWALLWPAVVSAQDWQAAGDALLARYSVMGAAVVVIADGTIEQSLVFGDAVSAPRRPVTEHTLFQAGSVSKPVASWALLRLVQEGRLQLDVPVSTYLTRWALPASGFATDQVTVRRLLSHTAGLRLGGYLGFHPDLPRPDLPASLDGATNGSGPVVQTSAPGVQFDYSGGGYTLLQLLVEEVTGQTFADYIDAAVLGPLGMQQSSYAPTAAQLALAADPHDRAGTALPAYRFTALAAAGLYTTATDLARFALANMTTNPVLSPATRALQQQPVRLVDGTAPTGLGWFVYESGLIGHSGSNLGWKADLWLRPAQGDGLVILTNSESGAEFAEDLTCQWASANAVVALHERCALRTEQSAGLDTIRQVLLVLTGLATVALLLRIVFGSRLRWPSGIWGRLAVALLLLLAVAVAGFMWTTVGANLVSGRNLPMATVNFIPYRMAESMPLLVALVVLAAAHIGLRRL